MDFYKIDKNVIKKKQAESHRRTLKPIITTVMFMLRTMNMRGEMIPLSTICEI
jgi:hypothetical protein